jgi:amidohydrolase
MPLLNRAVDMQPEIAAWRRELHQHPELMYDTHWTSAFVAEKLRSFGCDEVVTGIGRAGVVGIIKGRQGEGTCVGLRADMDALPIDEATGVPYASRTPGKMHACGHDGHTAMLLGAARHLAETRNFAGQVAVIFQPAEEGGAGGLAMVEDGMMERFGIAHVFGMHNAPGKPVGSFASRTGPLLAAVDTFEIIVHGVGTHAAGPHRGVDPIFIGAQIVSALQGIVSRSTDPLDSLVVTVTQFQAGDAINVIPATARLTGTIRSLLPSTRDMAKARVRQTAEGVAQALGGSANINDAFSTPYPVTVNHARETELALAVARQVAGESVVDANTPPVMGGEDFAYMLQARPGAMVWMGNGDSAFLHNPRYDFNDEAIPHGVSYWVSLAEKLLKAKGS